jgi:hypothetical protein
VGAPTQMFLYDGHGFVRQSLCPNVPLDFTPALMCGIHWNKPTSSVIAKNFAHRRAGAKDGVTQAVRICSRYDN